MGLLKGAFNTVCRLHSQPGYLKRPGTPDIYSPLRTTPSNYFRYLAGPSQIVVTGKEVVIPVSTMIGQPYLIIVPDVIPSDGTYTITLTINGGAPVTTAALAFDADGSDIQLALRLLTGLSNVTVLGDLQSSSLRILLVGVQTLNAASVDISALVDTLAVTITKTSQVWAPLIKRADKILLNSGNFTVKEIEEMPDLGGEIMGYRVRIE